MNLMQELQITGMNEFNMLQRAFAGGFTHANAEYTDEIMYNVDSYDFTSSYPYVMIAENTRCRKALQSRLRVWRNLSG